MTSFRRFGFVLFVLLFVSDALALPPPGRGRDPVFDGKLALEASQAAIGRTLDAYAFTDVTGKPVTLAEFQGKPLLISLIYTSCYHTCSVATRHLASVVEKAAETFGPDSFHVVTIGFDTRNDTPQAMERYARQQGVADRPYWRFLSGSQEEIDRLTDQLGFQYAPSPKGFDHTVQVSVVDAKGVVYRQVYGETFLTPVLTEPMRTLILGTPPEAETPIAELTRRIRFFCTTYDPQRDGYRFDYSLFVGMFCGATVIFGVAYWVVREWLRGRRAARR
ncbi:MAG: SCO family protein [Magnetococcales bacterium]|nr:SCO family protein [Magnetococcales bacterium]